MRWLRIALIFTNSMVGVTGCLALFDISRDISGGLRILGAVIAVLMALNLIYLFRTGR
jgi:hypothetical protein